MDPEINAARADDLTTLHHPVRRRMLEFLNLHGPSTVGAIAAGLGQQVGSVSHHMKTLEKAGFVEPAPELARDRRESVWRGLPRRMSWSITDFADSPTDTLLATAAERANLQHHADKVSGWLTDRDEHDTTWLDAAFSTELWATATAGELSDLADRVQDLFMSWTEEVRANTAGEDGAEDGAERGPRTPVFVFTHGNPARS
ncbi:helix-turn-helix domain-containing protein [soil metagenome]